MIWIIIGIVVYLLSAYGMWKYFHLAYSDKGRWSNLDADPQAIFITILPLLNTLAMIVFWLSGHPIEDRKYFNYNKFF